MKLLSYSIKDKSTDHCALLYDSEKLECLGKPVSYAIEDKKPCLYATFINKVTGYQFVAASIHHPGGKHDYRTELLKQIQPGCDFYVMGDYNHTQQQFNPLETGCYMHYPEQSTMAGSDYNNCNQAIDAVMSNQRAVRVERSTCIPRSRPATMPIVINFTGNQAQLNHQARPNLFQSVGLQRDEKQINKAKEAFTLANRALTERVSL